MTDGKLDTGDRIRDPQTGEWREVLAVTSGRMPTPIDPTVPSRGSSAERCAIYGGSSRWTTKEEPC
jgi:hypothetical protein